MTNNASFSAGSNPITLDDSNSFGSLTFTGGAGSITEDSSTDLMGASTATAATLTSAGSITDSTAVIEITATTLVLVSATGVGAVGNPLETQVGNLEAQTTTGGIFVSNTGALTIGGVSALTGVSAGGGDITVSTTSGDFTVSEAVSNTGGGNISLTAGTSIAVRTLAVNAAVSATGGNGSVALSSVDHVAIAAAVSVVGTGTITVDADTDLAAGGNVTNTATGTLTTAGGDVSIRAADIDLGAAVNVTTAAGSEVLLRPRNDAALINLGTDADLDLITAGAIRIGAAAQTGGIALTGQITEGAGYDTLALETGGAISDNTGTEQTDLTVTNLVLRAAAGIGAAEDLDTAVTNLAFNNAGGAVNLTNTGELTIAAVDGLATSSNTGTTTAITATSPLTFAGDTTTAGDTTYTATGSTTS